MAGQVSVECAPTKSGWECDVEVDPGEEHGSRHRVRVLHGDVDKWGRGGTPEALVERCFQFLLEREEPQAILKSFELADIQRYFPEFDRVMST